jgi:hypothetical protein
MAWIMSEERALQEAIVNKRGGGERRKHALDFRSVYDSTCRFRTALRIRLLNRLVIKKEKQGSNEVPVEHGGIGSEDVADE